MWGCPAICEEHHLHCWQQAQPVHLQTAATGGPASHQHSCVLFLPEREKNGFKAEPPPHFPPQPDAFHPPPAVFTHPLPPQNCVRFVLVSATAPHCTQPLCRQSGTAASLCRLPHLPIKAECPPMSAAPFLSSVPGLQGWVLRCSAPHNASFNGKEEGCHLRPHAALWGSGYDL